MSRSLLAWRWAAAILVAVSLTGWADATSAADDNGTGIVASIKPVHSIVSAVMLGVGEPQLLIRGASSPHTFSLRPSDAAVLADASVVFWIGAAMESSLAGPIAALAGDARLVTLSQAPNLVRRPLREVGAFERHAHSDDDRSDAENERRGGDRDQEGVGHDARIFDMHVWLDPHNADAMAMMIADVLSEVDPANAEVYARNATTVGQRLAALTEDIDALVAPARGQPFIMFHDAYRYFEDRFGLSAVGSVVVSLERTPGVKRVRALRAMVRELGAVCVFSEPQFQPSLVGTIIEDTQARSGVLDPLGAGIESGPELYFTLLRRMADSFRTCLEPDAGPRADRALSGQDSSGG
ncbi:MAG: zinc ABC transporter substrate-binding protein [Rhodospirillales bacterium]|nr:zinc ABC transporter substrate-binding protein [Rhodospirillales bacterium]